MILSSSAHQHCDLRRIMVTSVGLREELAMQFDETGPNTHTRRYWVSATVAIGAMLTFVILSVLLVLGVVFGPPTIKPVADSLIPWSLLVAAVAGVAMLIANKRTGQD